MDRKLDRIAVIGGGSAWMTAAALASAIGETTNIVLVESEAIGTVGVGEATIRPIRYFNQRIGIDEQTFVRETQGSFKLGIEFADWNRKGESYFHPFGQYGAEFHQVRFYHYWLRAHLAGDVGRIDDHCMAWGRQRRASSATPPVTASRSSPRWTMPIISTPLFMRPIYGSSLRRGA